MLGNPPLAIDYYNKVLKVEAKNKQAREELEVAQRVQHNLSKADAQTMKGEHRTAVYYLDRCLDDAPSCLRFMTMKAEALMFAKRYDDAQSLAKYVVVVVVVIHAVHLHVSLHVHMHIHNVILLCVPVM